MTGWALMGNHGKPNRSRDDVYIFHIFFQYVSYTIYEAKNPPEGKIYHTLLICQGRFLGPTFLRKHLADYVLVWAGERETDLRISTHFARIGNSVFPAPWQTSMGSWAPAYGLTAPKRTQLLNAKTDMVYWTSCSPFPSFFCNRAWLTQKHTSEKAQKTSH